MPIKYTCEGQDASPPLSWTQAPQGTQKFALIMDDPDAPGGIFAHWVLFNLPGDTRELPEALPTRERLSAGVLQGNNDFGKTGYGGPCPPPGRSHRYRLMLYALDTPLNLVEGATRGQVLDAVQGRTLAKAQLTITFGR